jgi:hypothetical protein
LSFVIPFFGEVYTTNYPNIFTPIVVGITFVMIMINNNKIQCRFLEFIGDSSYSIYLYHFPIIRLARLFLIENSMIEVLLIAAFTFVFAMFSYYYVEKSHVWINKLMEGESFSALILPSSSSQPSSTPKADILELPSNANQGKERERRGLSSNTTTAWFLFYVVGSIMLALIISNASFASCGTSAYSNLNPPPKISVTLKDPGLNPNNASDEDDNSDSNVTVSGVNDGSSGETYGAWEDVFSDYDAFSARLMTDKELKEDFYSSVYEGNSWPWYQDKQGLFEVCLCLFLSFPFLFCLYICMLSSTLVNHSVEFSEPNFQVLCRQPEAVSAADWRLPCHVVGALHGVPGRAIQCDPIPWRAIAGRCAGPGHGADPDPPPHLDDAARGVCDVHARSVDVHGGLQQYLHEERECAAAGLDDAGQALGAVRMLLRIRGRAWLRTDCMFGLLLVFFFF